jgi:hypothetical protein
LPKKSRARNGNRAEASVLDADVDAIVGRGVRVPPAVLAAACGKTKWS